LGWGPNQANGQGQETNQIEFCAKEKYFVGKLGWPSTILEIWGLGAFGGPPKPSIVGRPTNRSKFLHKRKKYIGGELGLPSTILGN
jgi:hypothetical protein